MKYSAFFVVAFLLDLAYNLTLLRFYGHRYSVENCQDWRRNESVGVVTMWNITDIVIQGQITLDILLRVCGC